MRNARNATGAVMAALLLLVVPTWASNEGAATLEELVEKCKAVTSMVGLTSLVYPEDRGTVGFMATMAGEMTPGQMSAEVSDEAEAAALSAKLDKEPAP